MNLKQMYTLAATLTLAMLIAGCGGDGKKDAAPKKDKDGTTAKKDEKKDGKKDGDHAHDDEVDLGKHDIDGIMVEAAQGHGNVEAGKEGHLVIKLPYKDDGATQVRAWIGTNDRTLSSVGKGEYAPSHDDYDIHADAPDPLPAGTKWWLEIEKPDGTTKVGSIPLLKDLPKSN